MSKSVPDDDIDLIDLFRRMGRTISKWLTAAGKALFISILFLIRNFIPLLFSFILGIGISFFIKWTTKPFYFSEITLRSNVVPNSEMIFHINKLEQLLREKSYSQVINYLSFSGEKDPGIIDLKAFWVIDLNNDSIPDFVDYRNRHNVYDTLNVRMKDRFVVRVKVREPGSYVNIRDGLLSYAENNQVFRKKNDLRLRQNNEMLARINYDITQLDSLQKVKYFEETRNRVPEKGGQMVFLQEPKTQLVYENIYALYKDKQFLETENNLYPEILSVLSDFNIPGKRFNGGYYYGKVVIPSAMALMLIALILIRNRKKLRDMMKKY
jgi:hypothetical protein